MSSPVRSGQIAVATGGPILPAVIADAGDYAARRFLEFVTATIRNSHTRRAYTRSADDFFARYERHRLALADIEPIHVAAYIVRVLRTAS